MPFPPSNQVFQRPSSLQYAGNAAEGKFDFGACLSRLHALRAKLDEETELWRQKGRELTARRSYVSSTLKDEHAKLNTEGIEVSFALPQKQQNVSPCEMMGISESIWRNVIRCPPIKQMPPVAMLSFIAFVGPFSRVSAVDRLRQKMHSCGTSPSLALKGAPGPSESAQAALSTRPQHHLRRGHLQH